MANAYIKFTGQKSGVIKGDATAKVFKDFFNLAAFSIETTVPYDLTTGLPTGRRQHHPAKVTIHFAPGAVQLWNAVWTNENLKEVKCVFTKANIAGEVVEFETVTFHNAGIIDMLEIGTDGQLVELSLRYQRILIESGTIAAQDDWEASL